MRHLIPDTISPIDQIVSIYFPLPVLQQKKMKKKCCKKFKKGDRCKKCPGNKHNK
jgi:hypothetical protein